MLPVLFAPLQGYTEDVYRRAHLKLCGGVAEYYTPFMRLEHAEVRRKDRFDMLPEHNEGVPLVIQVIAGDAAELRILLDAVRSAWHPDEEHRQRVDLNMGCPFPLQVRHGKGAGLIAHPERLQAIVDEMCAAADFEFSVKMRLGIEGADEWRSVLPFLNDAPLRHLTLHPRVARQQYGGVPLMDAFEDFRAACLHPLIYNGDITSIDEIQRLEERYPDLAGVMIGRGLLARPTLAREYTDGTALTDQDVIATLLRLHDALHESYASRIPGESQLLAKLRTFWDYAEPALGRKAWKKFHKAGNMKNYLAARNECACACMRA